MHFKHDLLVHVRDDWVGCSSTSIRKACARPGLLKNAVRSFDEEAPGAFSIGLPGSPLSYGEDDGLQQEVPERCRCVGLLRRSFRLPF